MPMDLVPRARREVGDSKHRLRSSNTVLRNQPAHVHAEPSSLRDAWTRRGLTHRNLVWMFLDTHEASVPNEVNSVRCDCTRQPVEGQSVLAGHVGHTLSRSIPVALLLVDEARVTVYSTRPGS